MPALLMDSDFSRRGLGAAPVGHDAPEVGVEVLFEALRVEARLATFGHPGPDLGDQVVDRRW